MAGITDIKLTDLPIEAISHILSFCDDSDICKVALTCKSLNEASHFPSLWISKVKLVLKNVNINTSTWTHEELYKYLLFKYGHTLGLWKCLHSAYGGIVRVLFDSTNSAIEGHQILPPKSPHIKEPVKRKLLFNICMGKETSSKQIQCCFKYQPDCHNGVINMYNEDGVCGFKFHCELDEVGHTDQVKPSVHMQQWIDEFLDAEDRYGFIRYELNLKKWLSECRNEFNFIARPLDVTSQCNSPSAIIKPGIFKGTYSVHGIEFVSLTYEHDKIIVQKITGDDNVPAGEITNMADLNKPMVLTRDQQTSSELVKNEVPESDSIVDVRVLPKQPVVIPLGWRSNELDIPDYCKARFNGQGQIAGSGFRNSRFSPGHWILFDENLFGFLWLELEVLGLYYRVTDEEIK